ncbi:MAG: hypothetical protein COV91_02365 [Candidatus Taylorbacteria bacterium CG11_big_fil_rev_8_21_14_0_20_46_11]|uniref:RNHCP domain-containing protein n=1 Tax=Candidatus Taylorbacteria bacterium CG11_big_fil_rev_8_21_14_0_20_46_11 TaxID=1975025 RepID=A0A2H0KBZ0_9BACT|nr:MAG: hypothetical protein COV91_02365 [Candidatus Taylorbacteria bacterium CG11_big_fil_rev_8_21_14_0_20_46_11]
MSFTRTIEDFICEQCGTSVTGTGYTNHCPKCLWSKHVDIHPGDRSSPCGGSMEPMSVMVLSGVEKITHTCTVCGFIRSQGVSTNDARDVVTEVSSKPFSSLK